MDRKMSCYERPQVFGKQCSGHGINPFTNTDVMLAPGLGSHTSAFDPLRTFARSSILSSFAEVQTPGTQHPSDWRTILLQSPFQGFLRLGDAHRFATRRRPDRQSRPYTLT